MKLTMSKFKFLNTNIFKITIIVSCFLFIYFFFNENEKIFNIIKNTQYKNSVFVIFLSILLIFFYSLLTFITLSDICKIKIPIKKWFLVYFNSQFLNSIPFFGIFYRANQLKKFNLNYDKFFGMYIMITWLYFFSLLFVTSIETFIFFNETSFKGINISLIFIVISLIIILFPYLFGKILDKIIEKFQLSEFFFFSRLQKLINLFILSSINKKFLVRFFKIFLIIHIIELLLITTLISSLQENIFFKDAYIIFVGMQLIDTVNLVPQNILISEIGIGFLVQELKYDFELGVLIKLYLRFIIFFSSIFLAIIYNIYYRIFK